MDLAGLPPSFPAAWRDGSHKQQAAPPPLVADAALNFLQPALRTLASATSAHPNTLATAALAERQHEKLVRPQNFDRGRSGGGTGGGSSSADFLLPTVLDARDRRTLDPRCILVIDFATHVREAPRDAVRALGRQMQRVASATNDSDVYAALAGVPALFDALRVGVGDELAPIFGAAAAVDNCSAAVLRSATQRVRTAGRLLKHASRDLPAWRLLAGGHQDLVNASATHEELEEDAIVSVPAAIALAAETPMVPATVPWLVHAERHAAF